MSVTRTVAWGSLQGMQKVETVEQMPDEYRDTLLKIIAALASTEFASVEQHQPWINQGPTPEDRYIQAQIAADEAHQGFLDCKMLRSFGEDGAAIADDLMRRRRGEHALEVFNQPFNSWVETVTFCFTLDLVAWYHLHAMENCSYAPLAREMVTMIQEEKFHASFGARRVRDLATKPEYQALCGAGRDEVQAAIDKWYPHSLDTFGKADSKFSALAVDFGIRRWGNEELREMYRKDIDTKIEALGLTIPPADRGRTVL
jgi:1,2-phenylacetyl-CoA epoxidase catalytic subunit